MQDYIVKINVKDDILPNINQIYATYNNVFYRASDDMGTKYNNVIKKTIYSNVLSICNAIKLNNKCSLVLTENGTHMTDEQLELFFSLFVLVGEININKIELLKDTQIKYFTNIDNIYIYSLDVLSSKMNNLNLGLTSVNNSNNINDINDSSDSVDYVENHSQTQTQTQVQNVAQSLTLNSTFLCELATSLNKCKVYFDIDCYNINDEYVNDNITDIINLYRELITELLNTYFKITEKPILSIYNSSTSEKLSLHIIVNNYYMSKDYQIYSFFKQLFCKHRSADLHRSCRLTDELKFVNALGIDSLVYNRTQALRLLNCTKPNVNNTKKMYYTDLPKQHTNINSLISFVPKNALELIIKDNLYTSNRYLTRTTHAHNICTELRDVKIKPSVIFEKYFSRINKIYHKKVNYYGLVELHNDGDVDLDAGLKLTSIIKKNLKV